MQLWYEGEIDIPDAVENIIIGDDVTIEDGMLIANGAVTVYSLNGALLAQGNDRLCITSLNQGVYIVMVTNQSKRAAIKLLIP
jgi:hypothetical protein